MPKNLNVCFHSLISSYKQHISYLRGELHLRFLHGNGSLKMRPMTTCSWE